MPAPFTIKGSFDLTHQFDLITYFDMSTKTLESIHVPLAPFAFYSEDFLDLQLVTQPTSTIPIDILA
jgi:hypothetical protein